MLRTPKSFVSPRQILEPFLKVGGVHDYVQALVLGTAKFKPHAAGCEVEGYDVLAEEGLA